MNYLRNASATVVAVLLVVSSTSSQEDKIILYNSTPVKVQLAGDKIAAFVGEAPVGYMEGYNLATPNKVIVESPSAPIVAESSASNGNLVNGQYKVMTNERILLNYKVGYATLDKAIINALDEVALRLKADPAGLVLLTAHSKEESSDAEKLSANRLSSAQTYLKIKGISLDRIQTEAVAGVNLNDVVAINFMR